MLKRDLRVGQRVYLTHRKGQPRWEAVIVDLSGQYANPGNESNSYTGKKAGRVVLDAKNGRSLIVVAVQYHHSWGEWVPDAIGPSKVSAPTHVIDRKETAEARVQKGIERQAQAAYQDEVAKIHRRIGTLAGLIKIGNPRTDNVIPEPSMRLGLPKAITLTNDQVDALLAMIPPESKAAATLAMLGTEFPDKE